MEKDINHSLIEMELQRNTLVKERDELKEHLERISDENKELEKYKTWALPGHYYSPIPSLEDIKSREESIFNKTPTQIPGIDLNLEEQISLLNKFETYYKVQPFSEEQNGSLRYYFNNPFFEHSDALTLNFMINHLKPKRILEVGSGYSSAVTLDTNEISFNNEIKCTFIEPYPERLLSLVKESDNINLFEKKLEDVNLSEFSQLEAGDILFIDSTHVSKIGSDVNYIFFEILPHINKGVHIHFHDVIYPFEYPKEWIYEGRAWNEAYLLRTFLQFNDSFRIKYWGSSLNTPDKRYLFNKMPLLGTKGGSIWIEKIK